MLEAVNKKGGGVFTDEDEKSLQTLAEFCSLLVSTCRMKENLSLVENQLEVQSSFDMCKLLSSSKNSYCIGCSRNPCLSQTML